MNEIDKLKIEHARYKQCLEEIRTNHNPYENIFQVADAALNPPPSVPVTLPLLIAALKKFSSARLSDGSIRGTHWIMFFRDESGGIENCAERIFTFNSLQEAYNFLNQ